VRDRKRKAVGSDVKTIQIERDSDDEDLDKEIEYPEECKVLDIMQTKYYDAI
jgi:hypothetical protein